MTNEPTDDFTVDADNGLVVVDLYVRWYSPGDARRLARRLDAEADLATIQATRSFFDPPGGDN